MGILEEAEKEAKKNPEKRDLVDRIAEEENWQRRAELIHEYRTKEEEISKEIHKNRNRLPEYVQELASESMDITLWLSRRMVPRGGEIDREERITAFAALTANLCKIIEISNGYDGPEDEDGTNTEEA